MKKISRPIHLPTLANFLGVLCFLILVSACASQKEKPMSQNPRKSASAVAPILKTDAEWKSNLDSMSYNVLRQCGTEPPFTGAF